MVWALLYPEHHHQKHAGSQRVYLRELQRVSCCFTFIPCLLDCFPVSPADIGTALRACLAVCSNGEVNKSISLGTGFFHFEGPGVSPAVRALKCFFYPLQGICASVSVSDMFNVKLDKSCRSLLTVGCCADCGLLHATW